MESVECRLWSVCFCAPWIVFLKVFLKGNVSKPGMPLSSLSVWAVEDEVVFNPLILTHPAMDSL